MNLLDGARKQEKMTEFLARIMDTEDDELRRKLTDDEVSEEVMGLL